MRSTSWMVTRAVAAAAAGSAFHAGPALLVRTPFRQRLDALSGKGSAGTVAVTFDDGPDPRYTPQVLDVLSDLGWTATFFMLGERVTQHPDIARRVTESGHAAAVHGYSHGKLLRMSPLVTFRELRATRDLLVREVGSPPRWFRPTYGALSGAALVACAQLRLRPVLWSSGSGDWMAGCDANSIRDNVVNSLGSGGTVVFHDAPQPSVALDDADHLVDALNGLASEFEGAGLRVVPLDVHLRRDAS